MGGILVTRPIIFSKWGWLKNRYFGFLCFTCSRKWLQKPRFLKVERNGLIGWRRHLSSELLIASHCCLFCSFIFKTSLVFQPQSRVVLNCAGPRVSTYSEVQEYPHSEVQEYPLSQVQEYPHTVKPTDCVQKTTECLSASFSNNLQKVSLQSSA